MSLHIRLISKSIKVLNLISISGLTVGVILLPFAILVERLSVLTIGLLVLGVISWILVCLINPNVSVRLEDISTLSLNTQDTELENLIVSNLEYLGNILKMKNGEVYEIHRKQMPNLISQIQLKNHNIGIKYRPPKYYQYPPEEIFKFLIGISL